MVLFSSLACWKTLNELGIVNLVPFASFHRKRNAKYCAGNETDPHLRFYSKNYHNCVAIANFL